MTQDDTIKNLRRLAAQGRELNRLGAAHGLAPDVLLVLGVLNQLLDVAARQQEEIALLRLRLMVSATPGAVQ